LRNSIWEAGYTIDTEETAVPWSDVSVTVDTVESSLRNGLSFIGERVFVFTHLSHFYPSGSGVYVTYLYRAAADPEETLRRWQILKDAASRAIVSCKGTISHQHGVGTDHMPFLFTEKGVLGIEAIRDLYRQFDPKGVMNPGKLV
jgi:alkyldihydroxyacetonephosphate synthase